MNELAVTMDDYELMRRRNIRATVATLVIFIAFILAGLWWRMQQVPVMSTDELTDYGAVLFDTPRTIRPIELSNHVGDEVSKDFLLGKWSVLFYGFTHCPDVCPATLRELAIVEQRLRALGLQQEWQAVMIAVDSERDTPAVLAPYLAYFSPSFIGLSGTDQQLSKLAADTNAAFGKVYNEHGSYTVDHSSQLVLINPKGDYAGFIKGPVQAARVVPVLHSVIEDFHRRYR